MTPGWVGSSSRSRNVRAPSTVTAAPSIPRAERSPGSGGIRTPSVPRRAAREAACRAPAPPKATRTACRGVVSPFHRDHPEGPLHGGIGHKEDPLGHLLRAGPISRAMACRGPATASRSRVPSPPRNPSGGRRPSQTWASVTVGSVPPLSVADGSREGPGAPGAHPERAPRIHPGQRSPARPDRVDVQHRHRHREPPDPELPGAQGAPRAEGHIRGGSAHVEGEDVGDPRLPGGHEGPHHPPAGPETTVCTGSLPARSTERAPPEEPMIRTAGPPTPPRCAGGTPT
jgi:hypothetical protein